MRDRETRGQVSMPLVEAGIGVILIVGALGGFAFGGPATPQAEAELDRYAGDVATSLRLVGDADGPPAIDRALRSQRAFESARPAITARLEQLVPTNLLYRVETPYGTIGSPAPATVPRGRARYPTAAGPVIVEVWYV